MLALGAESEWISARQLDWISRLKRELPNRREALEFSVDDDPAAGLRTAAALHMFWSSQGLYSEGRRWLDRLLDRQSGPPALDWVKGLYCASVMAYVQGDLEDTCAWLAAHAAMSVLTMLLRVARRAVAAIVSRVVADGRDTDHLLVALARNIRRYIAT